MNNLIEKFKKIHQELEEIKNRVRDSIDNSQEKIPQETVDDAQELVKNGKGIDVLWGHAILAMDAEQWEKACLYLEEILQQVPNDTSARLNLARCQTMCGLNKNITPTQRQEYFSKAEKFFQEILQQKETLSHSMIISIYILFAYLKKTQIQYTEIKNHKQLYIDAEQLLLKALALAPKNLSALSLLQVIS